MIYRNGAGQFIQFGSLVKSADGTRLTSGATVRVCKDGTWADGDGTLSVEEGDQYKYALDQAETNGNLLVVVIDHADAVAPLVFTCRTTSQIASDNFEKFFIGSGFGPLLLRSTIMFVTSQTEFTIGTGGDVSEPFDGCVIVIYGEFSKVVRTILSSTDSGGNLTLVIDRDPSYVLIGGEIIDILAPAFAKGDRTTLGTAATNAATAAVQSTSAATKATAIHAKLPSKTYLAGSNNSDGDIQLNEATGALPTDSIAAASVSGGATFKIASADRQLLHTSTIISVTNDTRFVIGGGSLYNDFTGCMVVVTDDEFGFRAVRNIISWDEGDTTIDAAFPFSIGVGELVEIFATPKQLEAIRKKLPSKNYLAGTANSDGDIQMDDATGNFPGSIGALAMQAKAEVNEQVDGAIADVGLTTTRTSYLDKLNIEGNVASSEDVAGGHITPVNQVPVPLARTWILKPGDDGWEGELPLVRRVGENQTFAVDFRNDLPNNGRLVSLDTANVISGPGGGIVISTASEDRGVDRSQAKFKINLLAVGTYLIAVQVTYEGSDGGGTSEGSVTLIVRPSLAP